MIAELGMLGAEAGAMWRMLTRTARDLKVELAEHDGQSAHWIARYTFLATGRPVVNGSLVLQSANVCSCMLEAMEPAVHRITILAPQPPTVWQRLEAVLADGGSPPIAMTRSGTTVTFTCDTGDFMLRARVADALMTVCDHGEWRRCFAAED